MTIGRKTQIELRKLLSTWTLREIADEFEAANIAKDDLYLPSVSGERGRLVEKYFHSLDLSSPGDLKKLVQAIEYILAAAARREAESSDSRGASNQLELVLQSLARDGFTYREGRLVPSLPPARVALRKADDTRSITEVTRRGVFDWLRVNHIEWAGRLGEVEFLERLYDLDALPSTDSRYLDARHDIVTHCVSFLGDWQSDWVYSDDRFELLNGSDDTLLLFLCEMLHPVVRDDHEVELLAKGINGLLSRDGWELVEQSYISGRPVFAARRRLLFDPADFTSAKTIARELDPDYLYRQIARMESAADRDPEAAIGFAKEFAETVCKTILDRLAVPYTRGDDLPQLSKKVCQSIRLLPEDVTDAAKGTDMVQRFAANLGSLVQGLAEIRGAYGTGHGKEAGFVGLERDHARFAVACATALGVFLVRRHQSDSRATIQHDVEATEDA